MFGSAWYHRENIREGAGDTDPAEVVVVEAPPSEPVEISGVAPGPNHVWVPGHWSRSNDRWVWVSGRWEVRPSPTSAYVPGHWEKRDGGYIWREGYWQ